MSSSLWLNTQWQNRRKDILIIVKSSIPNSKQYDVPYQGIYTDVSLNVHSGT